MPALQDFLGIHRWQESGEGDQFSGEDYDYKTSVELHITRDGKFVYHYEDNVRDYSDMSYGDLASASLVVCGGGA